MRIVFYRMIIKRLIIFLGISIVSLSSFKAGAQEILKGHVYATLGHSLSPQGIMVDASSGPTVFTDKMGNFEIKVYPTDTIYFYIGNRKSHPYLVSKIPDKNNFTLSMESILRPVMSGENIGSDAGGLEEVTVYGKNYSKDSLAARREYDKYFNYKDPKLGLNLLASPVTAIYDVLNVKKKKRMNMMKNDLLFNEQQGYIDTRFTKLFIVKYIGAKDDATLDDFMLKYRPKFEDLKTMTDMDLAMYVTTSYKEYEAKKGQ